MRGPELGPFTTARGGNESNDPSRPRNNSSPEILEIIGPALQVGGLAGVSGAIVGGFGGVVRSNTPMLFALASGLQWFTLASTFWASRSFLLRSFDEGTITPRDKVIASTIAGGVGGSFGGLLRGRKNIIPGTIMFALFGATSQYIYNYTDASGADASKAPSTSQGPFSWLNSKWSPVKVLSDAEYEDVLQEKLLRVNAEIALVEESIEALQSQEREMAAGTPQDNENRDTK